MTDYVFLDAPSCFTNEIADIPAELMTSVRSTVLKHLAQKCPNANLPDRDSLYHTIYNSALMQTCSENPDLTQEDAEDMLLYGGWTTALRNVLKELPELCGEAGMIQMPDCPPELPNVPESAEFSSEAEEILHEEFLAQGSDVTTPPAFVPEQDAHLEEERKARQALYRTSKPMKRVQDRLEPDEWPSWTMIIYRRFPCSISQHLMRTLWRRWPRPSMHRWILLPQPVLEQFPLP